MKENSNLPYHGSNSDNELSAITGDLEVVVKAAGEIGGRLGEKLSDVIDNLFGVKRDKE